MHATRQVLDQGALASQALPEGMQVSREPGGQVQVRLQSAESTMMKQRTSIPKNDVDIRAGTPVCTWWCVHLVFNMLAMFSIHFPRTRL